MEILRSGGYREDWSTIAFQKFLERKRRGNIKSPETNTLVVCPLKRGHFLNYFSVTKSSVISKRENEDGATARLRYYVLVSGFMCPTCCNVFFYNEFNDEMRTYILRISKEDKTQIKAEEKTTQSALGAFLGNEPPENDTTQLEDGEKEEEP